jgi:hypothetical protein
VLIAATRRTGSTLTAEALTELPRAFIFREPALFRGQNVVKDPDADLLKARLGLDISQAGSRERRIPAEAARRFLDDVAGPLRRVVEQVGIKEVRFGPRWREVLEELERAGPVRVVALGRDPRDQYLSLAYLRRGGTVHLRGDFGPPAVAADIAREHVFLREIVDATGAMRVRYEDLCADPGVIDAIRSFVDSPVRAGGDIGLFKDRNRVIHGREVTELRVARWQRESDRGLLAEAEETAALLADYRAFWGYD